MVSHLIFYLDDDMDDIYLFRQAASRLGHKSMAFMDGQKMLSALNEAKIKPSVIFLDVHMPILNGQEILKVLKSSEWKDIPVVMISGAYPKKLVRYFIAAGADYMMKKQHLNELQQVLDELLNNPERKLGITA